MRGLFFLGAVGSAVALAIGACAKAEVITPVEGDSGTTDPGCPGADLKSDPANCGTCRNACAKGQVCSQGACKAECDAPTIKCGTSCADIKTDPNHCGGCGKVCSTADAGGLPMGNGNPTDAGLPVPDGGAWDYGTPSCAQSKCGTTCGNGKQDCGGVCMDLTQMHDHCGTCGNACASDEWCTAGNCCKLNQTFCSGMCVDTKNDPNHCGSCGFKCSMQTPNCNQGTCTQGLSIVVEGHSNVVVNCQKGDYSCQAREVCNKVTGYQCVFQQYDCAYGNKGSWYPPDGQSGSSQFNFAYEYDFYNGNYGNICACNQAQMQKYGLAAKYQYCGLGHWQRQ